MCVCVYIYLYLYMYGSITLTILYLNMNPIPTCMHTSMHSCKYSCMHIYINITYIHIHIHIHWYHVFAVDSLSIRLCLNKCSRSVLICVYVCLCLWGRDIILEVLSFVPMYVCTKECAICMYYKYMHTYGTYIYT